MPVLSFFKEPRKKKSRRAYLIKAIDDLVSLRVRERDHHTCRKCGRTGRVYHHHIFGKKAHPSTRWEISNGITACYHCHVSAHASPEDFRRWTIGWMGEKEYEALYVKAQMRISFKLIDLEWMLMDLRKEARS